MPAAISAPNTASSRISVTGTEVSSALRKSCVTMPFAARSVLASPASSIRRPGCLACTAATARWAATTAVSALATLSGTWKLTSTDRRSAEISPAPPGPAGDWTSAAEAGSARSAVTTCADRLPHLRARRVGHARLPGLDQHALGRRDGEPDSLSSTRSARPDLPGVVGRQVLRADLLSGHEDRGDEQRASRARRSCGAWHSSRRFARRSARGRGRGGGAAVGGPGRSQAILNSASGATSGCPS